MCSEDLQAVVQRCLVVFVIYVFVFFPYSAS